MKSVKKSMRAVLLCLCFIFLFPLCAKAQIEGTRDIWIYVDRAAVPAGTARLELLVPAREAAVVDCNEKNCAAASIPTDCGIVAYEADGCVSLSFRTPTEEQDGRLIYQIVFRLSDKERERYAELLAPVEQFAQDEGGVTAYMIPAWVGEAEEQTYLAIAAAIPGADVEEEAYCGFYYDAAAVAPVHNAEFSTVKAAYLDENGNVLAVSDACSATVTNGYGAELRLSGTALTPAPEEGDYYYNPVLPILLAAAATLLFAVLLLSLLRVCMYRRKKRFLPAFFFDKTNVSAPVMKKGTLAAGLPYILAQLALFAGVVFIVLYFESQLPERGVWWHPYAMLAVELFAYYFALCLQTGVHEAGHVIFGKSAGFRIAYVTMCGFGIQKKDGRLRLRYHGFRFGGSTALYPPEKAPAAIRFGPMYLGGAVCNLFASLVAVAASFLWDDAVYRCALWLFVIHGVYMAFINAVPGLIPGAASDGTQLKNTGLSPEEKEIHADTMRISAALYRGERLKNLPDAWFREPTDASLSLPNGAANAAALFDRLLEEERFAEARALGERMIAPACALYSVSKSVIAGELLYCMAMTGARQDEIEAFYSKERRQAVLRLRPRAWQLRSKYAYELLAANRPDLAQKTRALYEKRYAKRSLPAIGAMEIDLMNACQQEAKHRTALRDNDDNERRENENGT